MRPKLSTRESFYWQAFGDLNSERPPAFNGVSRIPFFKIVQYSRYLNRNAYEEVEMLRVIQQLDAAFIDFNKRHSSKSK